MATQTVQLIVGLGNPGPKYQQHRHNVGAWWLERFAENHHASLKNEAKFFGLHAQVQHPSGKIHLLLPTTYMNESGKAVLAVAKFYKVETPQILVVHDELDLQPGEVRLKKDGGHAGHNGLRDIINRTGQRDFLRLRLGIGHPGDKDRVSSYVLSNPNRQDQAKIEEAIDCSLTYADRIIDGEFDAVMREMH